MAEFPGLAYIQNPVAVVKPPLALTSVFPVKTADAHDLLSGVTYESDACDLTNTDVDFDNYDDCIRTAAKEFDEGLLFVESITPIALYTALKCRPGALGGGDQAEYEGRVLRRFEKAESRALEAKLWAWVDAESNTIGNGAGDADATVSLLLKHADEVTNPVIHLSYNMGYLVGTNWGIDTLASLGIQVVVGLGYPDDTAFLTGAVNIWGGETQVNFVPDVTNNQSMALAERQYVMTVECAPFFATLGVAP
jgi:hypothetical protein